jgi:hypothetical protein
VGDYSAPVRVDLDADGDFDVFSGRISGGFSFFENTGTAASPASLPFQQFHL